MVGGRVSWFSPKSKIKNKGRDGAVREQEGLSIPYIFIHGFVFTEIGHFYGKNLIAI